MTQPAHAAPDTGGFLKHEPVIAGHIAAWVVLNLGVLLVSRYHVLTDQQWSALSLQVTAIVTAAVLALMGWLIRRVVTPAWKLATREAARVGVVLPGNYFGDPVGGPPVGQPDTSAADAALAAAAQVHPMPAPYMGSG